MLALLIIGKESVKNKNINVTTTKGVPICQVISFDFE
jgi:hypothetical protein